MATICKRCKRPLKSKQAIKDEYGPICKKKAAEEEKSQFAHYNDQVLRLVPEAPVKPLERYIVSDKRLIQLVADEVYSTFRQRFPSDKLEVLRFADHIQYYCERGEEVYNSADLTDEPEWFRQIIGVLRTPRAGVVLVREKRHLEVAAG